MCPAKLDADVPDDLNEATFPFLAQLSSDARRELAECRAQTIGGRRVLLERGASAGGAYLVTAGSLRVYYLTAEGREATLYRVEPGGTCILAITSTIGQEPYPAWVESGPEGAAFSRIPAEPLRRLLDAEAAFREFVFGTLSGRVFELMQALEEAGSVRTEQRVARFLLKRAAPDGTVRATQAAIAGELGTAREVVFRALRSLGARRLIETGRMRVRILDALGLRRAAGE
ncbi:MAG TPA: Crp/Fnr family transcriptional regulator [Burkholderiales bacterium]|nr:Crp/Fnr family transcriptional regulator [Burkholderiales bacterium]